MSTPLPIHPVRDDSHSDAVTTYFEQLARVPLLTREGEVDLARRIEEGERRALHAILASPVGARELAALGQAVRDRRVRLRDVTRTTVDEDGADEETRAVGMIADALERVGVV
ncbi:MAG TPA: sigma-70 factor domain-containing protein, partial [Polyangiaceae bacterium]|nr:sigma-70 factor domain-containing protein [Polyangiaceae bacterium]